VSFVIFFVPFVVNALKRLRRIVNTLSTLYQAHAACLAYAPFSITARSERRMTMNAKHLLIVSVGLTLLLSACAAPAGTSAPKIVATQGVSKEGTPEALRVYPTAAPAATQVAEAPGYATAAPYPTQPPVLWVAVTATPAPFSYAPTPVPTLPPDNFFQTYGVNPFVDTYEDHLSTFALDVDTASYSVMRTYVEEGHLPPAESVRVEEYVNYFQQDYANPENVAFGIYADGALSPFHTDGSYILRVGVQGYEVAEWQRKPANLTFVIDVSGSMADGNRLELVKQSLQLLVDRLRPDDTVAIVVYSTEARVALYPVNGADRDAILNTVYSLYPEASTNAEAGLRLGYELARQMHRADAVNRVILLSDGVANVGATGPDAILESISGNAKEYGITLTAVGVGFGNFNDVLLEQLADKGNGHYAYIDDLDEAQKLFVDDIVSTLQVIALDAKVQVDFNPDVVARYRLIGYENRAVADQDFRNNAVDAGEIGAGHTVTALYALQFRPNAGGRIATVQLRWKDPTTYQVTEINGNFNTWDLAPAFESASPRYQLDVTVAQYAELLRYSPWADSTSFSQILSRAARLAETLNDPDVSEFARLVSLARNIAGN
jgi:Ca-activated chloride channel family protein